MITRRRLMKAAAVSAFAVDAAARRAHAQSMHTQTWPSRHVRLVVPFPPGGGTDAVARIVASRLSGIWGHQMVIENKGGAGSNLGAEAVARSDPDGYTVLVGSLPLAVNRYLYSSLGYDPIADFAPVTLIAVYPNLMVVPNSSPARSVAEFVAHAKANPGRITFASSGVGTSTHLSGELFKRMTGIEMTHVPYRGVALALNDVIPGRDRRHVQHDGRRAAAGAQRTVARSCGHLDETVSDRPGASDRRRHRTGLRCLVVVRPVRAGEDASRDRAQAPRRYGRDSARAGHQ